MLKRGGVMSEHEEMDNNQQDTEQAGDLFQTFFTGEMAQDDGDDL